MCAFGSATNHAPPCSASPLTLRWIANGRVIRETRGSGGFGYDVLFCAEEFPDVTTAELDPVDKDAISHRGKALREAAPLIAAGFHANDRV